MLFNSDHQSPCLSCTNPHPASAVRHHRLSPSEPSPCETVLGVFGPFPGCSRDPLRQHSNAPASASPSPAPALTLGPSKDDLTHSPAVRGWGMGSPTLSRGESYFLKLTEPGPPSQDAATDVPQDIDPSACVATGWTRPGRVLPAQGTRTSQDVPGFSPVFAVCCDVANVHDTCL